MKKYARHQKDGKSWYVRLYKKGDEGQINDLFNEIFCQSRPLDTWKWKFLKNPAFPKQIITLADANGRIIGIYPSIIERFKFGDKIVLAAQPVDNCVHPDFRGGARVQIAIKKAFIERSKDLGLAFAFGFPNKIHYKIGKKLLKYEDLCSLPILFKRLNLRLAFRGRFQCKFLEAIVYLVSNQLYKAFYKLFRSRRYSKDIIIERITRFNESFDEFWSIASKNYQIITVRDNLYLNWRYIENPNGPFVIYKASKKGIVQGYIVLKLFETGSEKVGFVVDFFTVNDEQIILSLLNEAILYFLKEKVDYIKCAILSNNKIYQVLIKQGFSSLEGQNVVYEILDKTIDMKFFSNIENWFLTWGDSDLFG